MTEFEDWTELVDKFQTSVKGEDPKELEKMCLSLCQKYLMGNWIKLNVNDVAIDRLAGGMMNLVYLCQIPEHLRDDSSEPKQVVIRLYGNGPDFRTFEVNENRLEDNIKYVLLSENGFGPQVYGVAEKGVVMKYYQHRYFSDKDLYDKNLLEGLATKLALLHSMNPPIDKSRASIRDIILSSNRHFLKNFEVKRKLFEENNCETLLKCDLTAQTQWLFHTFKNFESPIVFSHNDFRSGNIMITEDNGIVIGDFDGTDYYYRGFDFATLFTDFIKLNENSFEFKDESIVRQFIGKYVTESAVIKGKQYLENEINSIEHILKEMKSCYLVYSILLFNSLLANEIWKFPFEERVLLVRILIEIL